MASEHPGFNWQPSPHIRHPSAYSYFTEQARRFGVMRTELARINLDHFQHYDNQQHLHLFPHYNCFSLSHPHDMAIQIELEKELIRSEIIMSEIATRRHILEAEVRRELMMERELALRQGNDRFSFGPTLAMGFNSTERLPLMAARAEERSLDESNGRERLNDMHKIGICEAPAIWTGSDDLRITEVNPVTRQGKEKEKIVLRAKPDDSVSGSKRKIETLQLKVDVSGSPSGKIVAKKAKKNWTCDLCQVNATSKRGLNEHLQGRKHKAKEAASKVQIAGKNYCIGFCPKKATKAVQVLEAAKPSTEEGLQLKSEYFLIQKAGGLSSEEDELPKVQEGVNPEKSKKTKPAVSKIVLKSSVRKKKNKFKHWCETCQVGTFSEDVMNAHMKGKKHAFWSKIANQNGPDQEAKALAVHMNQKEAPQDANNAAPEKDKALDVSNTEEEHACINKAEQECHDPSCTTEPGIEAVHDSVDKAEREGHEPSGTTEAGVEAVHDSSNKAEEGHELSGTTEAGLEAVEQ